MISVSEKKKGMQERREREEKQNSTTKDQKSILVDSKAVLQFCRIISSTYFNSKEHFTTNVIKHFTLNKLQILPLLPTHNAWRFLIIAKYMS